MLKKLLKYDLKDIYKGLVVFYILSVSSAILTRFFFSINSSTILDIIAKIFSGITISMIANILINNMMRIWVRFKQNIYGDESYLTHTLPVSKKTIYLSKFLTSIITMITSILVIAITLFIAYYSKENFELLKILLTPAANLYNNSITKFIIVILLVIFVELASALQSGYTGLILGHRKNDHKTLYSIVFGIATYFITQLVVLTTMFIAGIFNQDIMNLFYTNTVDNLSLFNTIIYLTIIVYTICIIVNYIINTKLFEKGVNVD